MKQLSLRFEDATYHILRTAKDKTNLTWERFLINLVKGGKDGKD